MLEISEHCPVIPLTLDEVQVATAQFALYGSSEDPEAVLHWGLAEEAAECAAEVSNSILENTEGLSTELGDMVWYISEKARHEGITLSVFGETADTTIDDFQKVAVDKPCISPIQDARGAVVDPRQYPEAAMNILALRVVDAKTRTDERLWAGHADGLSIERTIKDLFTFIALTADRHGLQLSTVLDQTITKLQTRPRKPHVMDYEPEEDVVVLPAVMMARRQTLATSLRRLSLLGEVVDEAL